LANKYKAKQVSVPLPENPLLCTGDVSIIVPTIDTEDSFTNSVRLWLNNKPREIIVVTIPRDLDRVRELLAPIDDCYDSKIHLLTVPEPNKREQMVCGIKFATGAILCLVDDDVFWPHDRVLPHLLAPLENERIGAVGGPQK
jgi:glycosyltransferase involved in cell wall biosynthesis